MKITVIDYGAGNIASVLNALQQVVGSSEIAVSSQVSDLKSSTHLILPGVSAFGETMNGLKAIEGLLPELRRQILKEKKPFFGICAGMQVMASIGFEDGQHQGLGFIDGRVEKISVQNLKVPHMGWNEVYLKAESSHPMLNQIKDGEHFYFANSYRFVCQNANNVLGKAIYGEEISAIIAKENIFGVQFHPEKSAAAGLKLLENFTKWRP
jgi:glutamine amidotransferase